MPFAGDRGDGADSSGSFGLESALSANSGPQTWRCCSVPEMKGIVVLPATTISHLRGMCYDARWDCLNAKFRSWHHDSTTSFRPR